MLERSNSKYYRTSLIISFAHHRMSPTICIFSYSSISCLNLDEPNVNQNTENANNAKNNQKFYSASAPASTNALLGNFEVSVLSIVQLTRACRKSASQPEYVIKVRPWIMLKQSLIGTDITDLFLR